MLVKVVDVGKGGGGIVNSWFYATLHHIMVTAPTTMEEHIPGVYWLLVPTETTASDWEEELVRQTEEEVLPPL